MHSAAWRLGSVERWRLVVEHKMVALQDQIYLIFGIGGAFIFIYFLAVLIICGLLCKFKRDLDHLVEINRERYAFNNPTILPGEELSYRGYQQHRSSEGNGMFAVSRKGLALRNPYSPDFSQQRYFNSYPSHRKSPYRSTGLDTVQIESEQDVTVESIKTEHDLSRL